MPLPTIRAALLLAAGAAGALAATGAAAAWPLLALDLLVLALVLVDGARAPRPGALRARRTLRTPLVAFAPNRIALRIESVAATPLRLSLADAPPPELSSTGHRRALVLPPGGAAELVYEAVPRARGRVRFGDLHVRAAGPLGLAARQWTVPLAREVPVYPDLRAGGAPPGPAAAAAARPRARGVQEGRELAGLRPYLPGDDVRAIDWKATARRGAPVVREWQPERNQTLWLLLDCGRHLSPRLEDGRTRLDHAVDATLALARAAVARGDRAGAVLFGAEVERVVPPGRGQAPLAPLVEALHLAQPRLEESDYAAAFEALAAHQDRRALVVVFTDVADPDTSALLLATAERLRRRHLVLVAALADPALSGAAGARPRSRAEALARVAAERILAERDAALSRLAAAGVLVESVAAGGLAAAVVGRYLEVKQRGEL